jgi:WD40 repeat protein
VKSIFFITAVCTLLASTAIFVDAQSDPYIHLDVVTELQLETPSSAKWSSNSAKLAVVVWPDIQIWDAHRWELLVTIPDAFVYSIDWHPQDEILAAVRGGRAEHLLIWDANTGELLRQIVRPAPPGTVGVIVVDDIAWHPSGERIVTSSVFDTLLVWDLTVEDIPYVPFSSTLAEQDPYGTYEIAWSSDGQTLLASGSDGSYRAWDMATRNEFSAVGGCCYFAWNPQNNEQFVGTSPTGQVHVWNTRTTDSVMTFEEDWDARASFAWSPDGRLIAGGYPASSLKIWDAETGTSFPIRGQTMIGVENVVWRPDNLQIAVIYDNETIIYNYETID